MSATLASAKAFTYRSNNFMEVQAAATGQFLTFFVDTEVALQRPNKLRINVSGDVPSFQFYFDGTKVSAFDPQKNVHSVSGPIATIDEMLDFVTTKAHINFPSADFMYSNPYAVMTKNLTHAIVVGPSMVNGVPCEHFAYMEPALNWEIWIENGKRALPLAFGHDLQTSPQLSPFYDRIQRLESEPQAEKRTPLCLKRPLIPGKSSLKLPGRAKIKVNK